MKAMGKSCETNWRQHGVALLWDILFHRPGTQIQYHGWETTTEVCQTKKPNENPEDFLWAFHENFYPQNSLLYGKFLPTPYIDWIQRCGVRSVKSHSCQVDVCVSPCPAGLPGPHWRGAVAQHQYDLRHWHTWGQSSHSEEHNETKQYCHSDEHEKTVERCVLAVRAWKVCMAHIQIREIHEICKIKKISTIQYFTQSCLDEF